MKTGKKKYIQFTFNGGDCKTMKYSDYLKNKEYWDKQLASRRVFFD